MSDFLLEIYSEEIPSRMQKDAASNLKNLTFDTLSKEKLTVAKEQITVLTSPQRVSLIINNLKEEQQIPAVQIIGPKVGVPEKALQGFLRSNGLQNIDDLEQIDRGGTQYFCYFKKESKILTKNVISSSIEKIIDKMTNSWPKIMKYQSQETGQTHKWIRPVRNILCLFDNNLVNIELLGLKSNKNSYGHFLHSNNPIEITSVNEYQNILLENFVIVDQNKRRVTIQEQIDKVLANQNLSTIDHSSSEIFNEINGICEFPTVLTGEIDKKFMDLPHEILTLTLKSNQKFLCLKDQSNELSRKFIFVSNPPIAQKNSQKIINDNCPILFELADNILDSRRYRQMGDTSHRYLSFLTYLNPILRNGHLYSNSSLLGHYKFLQVFIFCLY